MNEYSFEVKAVVRVKFILVNGRTPRPQSFCALCCEPIGDSYLRETATRFCAGEWICRRSNRWRDSPHRLLLSGWPLPQRNPLELLCEGMMRQPQICDHCGGHFGMLTHRWWGNKFCKRTCKDAYLRELALGRDKICPRDGRSQKRIAA